MTWAERVYQSDKAAAALCRTMQLNGLYRDPDRTSALISHCTAVETRSRAEAEDAVGRSIRKTKTGGFGQSGPDGLFEAFFVHLRAPVYFRSRLTGKPSLDSLTLTHYAACRDERLRRLALSVLEWRRARKCRTTYLANVRVGRDGRVHPTWKNYGAVSGRFACQSPNVMNLPRLENDPTRELGGVRTVYAAPPGFRLVSFDCAQLEIRVAAYASGDQNMISHVLSGDVHAARAGVLFGEGFTSLDPESFERKVLRNLTKTFGLAVNYLAEAPKVHATIVSTWPKKLSELGRSPPSLRECEVCVSKLKRGLVDYFRWQDQRYLDCVREGWTDSPILGRRRWLSHDPSPTECANFPIQSGAADIMNERLPRVVRLMSERVPLARLVAQVHDSGVFEVPEDRVDDALGVFSEIFAEPVTFATSGLSHAFPIDTKVSQRWN